MRKKLSDMFFRLNGSDLIPVFFVIASVQGTVIISQFLATFILTPKEMGVIRSLESILSILILVAGIGAQSLVIRDVALTAQPSKQVEVLSHGLLAIGLGCILSISVAWGVSWLLDSKILMLVAACAGLIALSNVVRLVTAYAHGARRVRYIFIPVTALSGFSVCLILVCTFFWGVQGWIVGRHLGELLMLLALLKLFWEIFKFSKHLHITPSSTYNFLKRGLLCNVSLALRMCADVMPILLVTALKVPTDFIAQIGMSVLATQLVILPLAVAAQFMLPRVIASEHMCRAAIELKFRKRMFFFGVIGASLFGITALLGTWMLQSDYDIAFQCGVVLAFTLPFRALILVYGNHAVVKSSYKLTAIVNLIECVVIFVVGSFLYSQWGILGVAAACLIGAVITYVWLRNV